MTKVDFNIKSVTRIERHFITIKGLGGQENIIILNATEQKNSIYGSTIFVEEFNTSLRTTRQKK